MGAGESGGSWERGAPATARKSGAGNRGGGISGVVATAGERRHREGECHGLGYASPIKAGEQHVGGKGGDGADESGAAVGGQRAVTAVTATQRRATEAESGSKGVRKGRKTTTYNPEYLDGGKSRGRWRGKGGRTTPEAAKRAEHEACRGRNGRHGGAGTCEG